MTLSDLRALLDRATPGPWDSEPCMCSCNSPTSGSALTANVCGDSIQRGDAALVVGSACCSSRGVLRPEDSALIVALRNIAPALLDIAEKVENYYDAERSGLSSATISMRRKELFAAFAALEVKS